MPVISVADRPPLSTFAVATQEHTAPAVGRLLAERKLVARRARIAQVSAALVLGFLLLLAVGGAVIYANSKPFREGLVANIGAASGATVELVQFRMNPRAANAGAVALARTMT